MNTRTALNIALSSLLRDLDSRHSHPEQIPAARRLHEILTKCGEFGRLDDKTLPEYIDVFIDN